MGRGQEAGEGWKVRLNEGERKRMGASSKGRGAMGREQGAGSKGQRARGRELGAWRKKERLRNEADKLGDNLYLE